jgi:hypothetical protein
MSRLYDRLSTSGVRITSETAEQNRQVEGAAALGRARGVIEQDPAVYEITNVVNLYREQRDQYPDTDSFPMVAPPHDAYFMEARWPQGSLDAERFTEPKQVGLLFQKLPDSADWDGPTACALRVLAIGFWRGKPDHLGTWKLIIDSAGGISVAEPKASLAIRNWHSRRVARQVEVVDERLDKARFLKERMDKGGTDAELAEAIAEIDMTLEGLRAEADEAEGDLAEVEAKLDELLMGIMESEILYPALLTHSLLNCRNVETETKAPPAKLSKRHQRKRGRPMVTFKTLKVNPMGRRSSGGGGGGGVDLGGGQTALHIVRGHFKTYTADRPLLGKHVGTYWWSANVRGSIDNGVVVKDYEVEV